MLQNHWNTWITQQDLADIAGAGYVTWPRRYLRWLTLRSLNHVRIPIGYWAFEVGAGEPYIQGQLQYLQNAIGWAGDYGLKVIVDLHGLPGSQNGCVLRTGQSACCDVLIISHTSYDNSGHRIWPPTWQSDPTNVQRTDAILKQMASLFANNPQVVSMMEPVNE